ncbi:MAG: hypothetical protein QM680_06430 [Luteolibacter sp.]
MESHEWNENTEEGKRYYRVNYQGGREGGRWTVLTTLQKRDPKWDIVEQPGREIWTEVRDLVWKKYQRKRLPWERVEEVDKILEKLPE